MMVGEIVEIANYQVDRYDYYRYWRWRTVVSSSSIDTHWVVVMAVVVAAVRGHFLGPRRDPNNSHHHQNDDDDPHCENGGS